MALFGALGGEDGAAERGKPERKSGKKGNG